MSWFDWSWINWGWFDMIWFDWSALIKRVAAIKVDSSVIIGGAAAITVIPYLRRLSMVNWHRHLWHVVAMHLVIALWLLWIAYDGLTGVAMEPYNALGVIGALLTWATSRVRWKDGPPEYTLSGPVPLDDGELISTHGRQR